MIGHNYILKNSNFYLVWAFNPPSKENAVVLKFRD